MLFLLPMIKHFKEMSTSVTNRARVLVNEVEVFFGHLPNKGLNSRENSRIGKISFGCHYGVHSSALYAPLNVSHVLDITIGDHWYINCSPIFK